MKKRDEARSLAIAVLVSETGDCSSHNETGAISETPVEVSQASLLGLVWLFSK